MSLKLICLAVLIASCAASPLSSYIMHASLLISSSTMMSSRVQAQSAGFSTGNHKRGRAGARHPRPDASIGRITYLGRGKGTFYGIALGKEENMMPTDEMIVSSINVEQGSTDTTPTWRASSTMPTFSSSATPESSFMPILNDSRLLVTHSSTPLHSALPAVIGSVIAAVILIASGLIIVTCRRRIRTRDISQYRNAGLYRWFGAASDKKDNVVFIRVPPPVAPIRGILIRNESIPMGGFDRRSVTSSQMSILINSLPKSYDSGLEDGVLDEVKEHGCSSPVKVATRIGPSPSDFMANLFGLRHAESFDSRTSSATGESVSPLPSPMVPPPPHYAQAMEHNPYQLPVLTSVHSPILTYPPAAASPSLSVTSGPRGHGLVLTGDQVALPSFAHWHYQRQLSRSREGSPELGPQF